MKRIISLALTLVLIFVALTAFTACGDIPRGEYKSELFGTYTFKGNRYEYTVVKSTTKGRYKIKTDDDGHKTITMTAEDGRENTYPIDWGADSDGNEYVEIGSVKYKKVK